MYTKEQLKCMHLHDIRTIGRNIGVKSPTSKTKTELIDKILAVQNGKEKPCFSRVGRRAFVNDNLIDNSNSNKKAEHVRSEKEQKFHLELLALLEKQKNEIISLIKKHSF